MTATPPVGGLGDDDIGDDRLGEPSNSAEVGQGPPGHDASCDDVDWDAALAYLLDSYISEKPPIRASELVVSEAHRGDRRDQPGDEHTRIPIHDVCVPGVGVVPAGAVRSLVDLLGPRVTSSLLDERSGVTYATTASAYRPSEAIRRFVVSRDRHCRFPGCTVPADRCDVDHVVAWPTGETTPTNLHLLCRHHHCLKSTGAWSVVMSREGVDTWTSPTGRRVITSPND